MISIISFSQLRFYINNQTNKILIKIDFILINNQKTINMLSKYNSLLTQTNNCIKTILLTNPSFAISTLKAKNKLYHGNNINAKLHSSFGKS